MVTKAYAKRCKAIGPGVFFFEALPIQIGLYKNRQANDKEEQVL